MYRTGDVARYTFDGEIEYLRRNDKQVKIRGFRIELGEIEKSIRGFHDLIDQAVAVVREDSAGNPTLIAYWTADQAFNLSDADLREHLRGSLPHYMIPKHFVRLEEFPQTSNGKIDHKALPEPTAQAQVIGDIIPPATESEKYLAEIWEESLDIDGISIDDNFFELGGHSLLVMQVIAKVEEQTGTRLGPQDFLIGTLENLANQIESQPSGTREKQANPSSSASKSSVPAPTPPTASDGDTQDSESNVDVATERRPSRFSSLKGFWD
jgi:acyl carrier protein